MGHGRQPVSVLKQVPQKVEGQCPQNGDEQEKEVRASTKLVHLRLDFVSIGLHVTLDIDAPEEKTKEIAPVLRLHLAHRFSLGTRLLHRHLA